MRFNREEISGKKQKKSLSLFWCKKIGTWERKIINWLLGGKRVYAAVSVILCTATVSSMLWRAFMNVSPNCYRLKLSDVCEIEFYVESRGLSILYSKSRN